MRAFRLESDGSREELPLPAALTTAQAGAVVLLEQALTDLGHLDVLVDRYLDRVATVTSAATAARVRSLGLQHLHEVLPPDEVIALLDALDRDASDVAIPLCRAIVEAATDPTPHYFIGSDVRIRAMVPVDLIDHDEALRPRRMHGRLVPLGPHRDVNATIPFGGLSLWCAVTRVVAENSFAIYDDGADGAAVVPEVDPGDVIVFGTERLHASVRNTTNETRLAVTARVVLGRRLRFGPGVRWTSFADASLAGTRLDRFATLQSRLSKAALLRWRHTRRRRRRLRAHASSTTSAQN